MLPFAEAAPSAADVGTVVLVLVTLASFLLHCKQLFGWGKNPGDAVTRAELARVERHAAAQAAATRAELALFEKSVGERIEKLTAYSHEQAHAVRNQLNATHLTVLARVEEVARRMERLAARLGD